MVNIYFYFILLYNINNIFETVWIKTSHPEILQKN